MVHSSRAEDNQKHINPDLERQTVERPKRSEKKSAMVSQSPQPGWDHSQRQGEPKVTRIIERASNATPKFTQCDSASANEDLVNRSQVRQVCIALSSQSSVLPTESYNPHATCSTNLIPC